jgi:glutamate dehydrogenase/leucine dehydrogenase
MRVIIVGAGEVGYELAKFLSMEEVDIVVIDQDAKKLSRVSEELDVATIAADGLSPSGLREAGPTDNYRGIPFAGKWVLIFCMLAGRLEIYTVVILFVPRFWKI